MKTTKQRIYSIVLGGMIAALYAAATYASISPYNVTQLRFSEALTILPVFTPAAIPGLTIGCFIANMGSTLGWIDMVFGTAASLIAAFLTYKLRKVTLFKAPVLAPLAPVLVNAIIVGLELSYLAPEGLTFIGFLGSAISVGFSELIVCYGLGLPLWYAIKKIGLFEKSAAFKK